MGKRQDLTGQKFHRLLVESCAGKDIHGQILWNCICDCGNRKVVTGSNLRGKTHSCGCVHRENIKTVCVTHGQSRTKTHKIWKGVISRCYATGATGYANYGGRGIGVCERWRTSFSNFIADMGECPSGFSIERIDGSLGYEPSNCVWADRKTQNSNRRSVHNITANGITMNISDWATTLGISERAIRGRLSRGWSEYAAVTVRRGECKRFDHCDASLRVRANHPIKKTL